MNPTFKQLEAFYFSARLGSFSAAAASLHTTQSAISKRVGDLEGEIGGRLLHRRASGLTLTPLGERILPLAGEAQHLRQRIAEKAGQTVAWEGNFRLGVTEMTATTWLGELVKALRAAHPKLTLEPHVAAGLTLVDMLRNHELDLVIVPGTDWKPPLAGVPVGQVRNVWMASPMLDIPARPLKPAEFVGYPVLEQSQGSAKNRFYEEWKNRHGFRFNRVFATNSLIVIGQLTVAGQGIAQLSPEYFQPELSKGLLRIVYSDPMPPPMTFSAVYRQDGFCDRAAVIAELAASFCDFTTRQKTA